MPGEEGGIPGAASPLARGRSASRRRTSAGGMVAFHDIAADRGRVAGLELVRHAVDRLHRLQDRDFMDGHLEVRRAHVPDPSLAAAAARIFPHLECWALGSPNYADGSAAAPSPKPRRRRRAKAPVNLLFITSLPGSCLLCSCRSPVAGARPDRSHACRARSSRLRQSRRGSGTPASRHHGWRPPCRSRR